MTRTVLLMVPTLTAPFFGPVYTGAARVAARHGFGVVVSTWPDDAVRSADSPFAAPDEAIDGILASSVAVEALGEFRDTPAVMLDSGPADGAPCGPVPTVDFGVADGMAAIAAHLGGPRPPPGTGTWPPASTSGRSAPAPTPSPPRVSALPGGHLTRAACAIEVASAKDAAGRLLDAPDPPTVLVCDDDLIAAGAYKAARARGLDIPADLSVTGFDDVLLATALEPELTTVRLPAEELGAQGMALLLDLLSGGSPEPRVLPGELVVRDSTAPPARRNRPT